MSREADDHPSLVDPEVVVSPDGDPARTGTIRAAVSLSPDRFFGPLDVLAPTPADDTESRLLVAERHHDLIVAQSVDGGLAGLYEDERARRAARDALLDVETWRR